VPHLLGQKGNSKKGKKAKKMLREEVVSGGVEVEGGRFKKLWRKDKEGIRGKKAGERIRNPVLL